MGGWVLVGGHCESGRPDRINGLNGSAVVMQTGLSWGRRDLGKGRSRRWGAEVGMKCIYLS